MYVQMPSLIPRSSGTTDATPTQVRNTWDETRGGGVAVRFQEILEVVLRTLYVRMYKLLCTLDGGCVISSH